MHTLVCLHGWGASKESFTELTEALKGTDVEVVAFDLPGFGKEPEPNRPFTVDDYADWVIEKLRNAEMQKCRNNWSILGHSNGGRIAIKLLTEKFSILNSQFSIPSHLYLCASAGIRHPRHIKRIFGLVLAKLGKALLSLPLLKHLEPLGKKLLYKLVRVHDYENASDVMRKTLINVSKEDLRPLLKDITVPTDIFWGEDDSMTPFSDAKIMEKEIPNALLHSFKNVRHRVHRDRAKEIAGVICSRQRYHHASIR